MAVFLQIFLINLAVSCDNVGVIALATQNLPEKKAAVARQIGIWLSLLLKLLFIKIIGYLFGVSWLHIRIIGGILLLYITCHMLQQDRHGPLRQAERSGGRNSFLLAVASIAAVDISMSLDNVIAILSIVTEGGRQVGGRELLLILGALLACVPVLLWFSSAISRLMERFSLLSCLCSGYLVYIAVAMIFEDELLVFFLEHIHFTHAQPVAILFGLMAALYGFTVQGQPSPSRRRFSGLLAISFFVLLYSMVSVAAISYLGTHPVVDGRQLSVELLYEFSPSGANAVYAIGAASELPTLCTAVLAGMLVEQGLDRFHRLLPAVLKGLLLFLLLELAVSTVGLTSAFGFGELRPGRYLLSLLLQGAMLACYAGAFCAVAVRLHSRSATVVVSFLLILSEGILALVCMHTHSGQLLAGLFPSYYLAWLPMQNQMIPFALRGLLTAALWIVAAWRLGMSSSRRLSTYAPS